MPRLSRPGVEFFNAIPREYRDAARSGGGAAAGGAAAAAGSAAAFTHRSLDGKQKIEREIGGVRKYETIHHGGLRIPDDPEFYKWFITSYATAVRHVDLFLDESKTDVFPMFGEIDASSDYTADDLEVWVKMACTVPDEVLEHFTFRDHLEIVINKDVLINSDPELSEMFARKKFYTCDDNKYEISSGLKWSDLFKALLEATREVQRPLHRVPKKLIECLGVCVGIAITRVMQKVIQSFYPTVDPTSSPFVAALLTNKGSEAFVPTASGKYKMGAHVYFPYLLVDSTQASWMIESIVQELHKQYGKDMAFWREVMDIKPILSPIGGMRMPFSKKAEACTHCTNGRKRKRTTGSYVPPEECFYCEGTGKRAVDRYYGPTALLSGSGVQLKLKVRQNNFFCKYETTMDHCKLRVIGHFSTTKGFNNKGKPEPLVTSYTVDPVEKLCTVMSSERAAKNTIKNLCERHGLLSDKDPMLIEMIKAIVAIRKTGIKFRVSQHIEPLNSSMEQYKVLQRHLPALLSNAYTTSVFDDVEIESVVLVHESDDNSMPKELYVFPRKRCAAAGLCYNRAPLGGDAGSAGEHSHKCTYFRITRESAKGTGYPEITQLCSNPHNRPSTRRVAKCRDWPGHTVRIVDASEESMVIILRHIFFHETLHTEEHTARLLEVEARRIKMRYGKKKKRDTINDRLVGPTASYNLKRIEDEILSK